MQKSRYISAVICALLIGMSVCGCGGKSPASTEAFDVQMTPEELLLSVAETSETQLRVISSNNISGDYTYNILSDDTAIITGYHGSDAHLVVPSSVDGYRVSRVIDCENTYLERVEFSEGITEIRSCFNNCPRLSQVVLPDSLREAWYSFREAPCLYSVDIPENVVGLGRSFNDTPWYDSLTDEFVVVGDGLWFKYNGRGGTVTVPEGIKHTGCDVGKELQYDIETYSFYTIVERDFITELIFPQSMRTIGQSAFDNCKALRSVQFNQGLASIGNSAFGGCENMREIVLPDSLRELGRSCFMGCSSLESVIFPDKLREIGSSAFWGCPIGELRLPQSLLRIGSSAFESNEMLENLVIPQSVAVIEEGAFSDCENLNSVTLPENTIIKRGAFYRTQYLNRLEAEHYRQNLMNGSNLNTDNIEEWSDSEKLAFFKGVNELLKNADDIPLIMLNRVSGVFPWLAKELMPTIEIPEGVKYVDFSDVEYLMGITLPQDTRVFDWGMVEDALRDDQLEYIYMPPSVTAMDNVSISDDFLGVILCHEGSFAEQFAIENGLFFCYYQPGDPIDYRHALLRSPLSGTTWETGDFYIYDLKVNITIRFVTDTHCVSFMYTPENQYQGIMGAEAIFGNDYEISGDFTSCYFDYAGESLLVDGENGRMADTSQTIILNCTDEDWPIRIDTCEDSYSVLDGAVMN